MTSHTSTTEHLLGELRARALAAVYRSSQHLAAHVDAGREGDTATQTEIAEHRPATTNPPDELITAMRSPAGVQQLVHLHGHGHRYKVLIDPIGYPSPYRERRVWQQISTLMAQEAA